MFYKLTASNNLEATMTGIRLTCLAVRTCSNNLLAHAENQRGMMLDCLIVRSLSSIAITKNISLISNEKKKVQVKNLALLPPQDKPLVVMPTWLMAKKKHTNKYAQIYLEQGFDVLNISVTPWQLLWPVKGTQVVAGDILKFLDVNKTFSPLFIHGFSVGAYLWGEVLVKIAAERARYQPLVDRIVGQVWDSAADITEISIGVPVAVFPNNTVMQNALRSYMLYHLKTFDKVATCHYVRSSQMFHTNLVRTPALMFCSKSDPIGAVKSNQRARENWENMGMKVYWNCFEKSPHVGHMQYHAKEYLSGIYTFMDKLGLISIAEKVKVKV